LPHKSAIIAQTIYPRGLVESSTDREFADREGASEWALESATRTHPRSGRIFFALKKKLRVHSTALEKTVVTVVIEERVGNV